MKKKIEITIFILILLLIGVIGIILFNLFYDRTNYIKGHDYLYDVAIDYLRSHKDDLHRGDDYQQIISYHGFGISSDDKYQYAYMWILEESYYVKDQKLYSGSGSSMAYKFTFRNDKVVRYEIPLDGSNYASSMKKIFPKKMYNQISRYDINLLRDENLKKIEKHYSYLDSTEINY